jgi:soluble lytic murein transglycosylase
MGDPDAWWAERSLQFRAALAAGERRAAYEIAAKHGPLSRESFIEAETAAGWISLRFLDEPRVGFNHFLAARVRSTSSKEIALTEYWLGRTKLALGDVKTATTHFTIAARYPQSFYGQLGSQELDGRPADLVLPTPAPTQADIDRFVANDAVRAIAVAMHADLDQVTPQFFLALSRSLKSRGEIVLLAEFAKAMGRRRLALTIAKIAFNRDLPVADFAFPLGVLPAFKTLLDEQVDPALVHALSRQESEFSPRARSPVGATGLMQLMPATARSVAKQFKVKYEPARLAVPVYNIQLGEAFLGDLIRNYSGSYVLALAAYNAGGGRVQEWINAFGDPRRPDVDPIDWIEQIPIIETRNYVTKIMETLQLYRARLQGSDRALRLAQDLNRGRRTNFWSVATEALQERYD